MKTSQTEAVAATRTNPGETLRAAREEKGWTLEYAASQLNLTPTSLGQIEAGSFDKLPGHTFARGYIRAYAKLLGMDQAQMVSAFDHYTGTDASGSSVHALGRIEEPMRLSQNILRFVSFALLVALGLAGFFWWQGQSDQVAREQAGAPIEHVEVESADGTTQIHPLDEPEDQAVVEAREPDELSLPVSPEVASGNDEAAATAPNAAAGVGQSASGSAPASAPLALPAAPTATQAQAAASEVPVAPAAGEGVVAIQFVADCWTQVTDASGKVLVSMLKRKGDSLQVTGKAPLELRLGYARGAQVSYNGQPVDMTSFTRGETARLKLGQ
ncbi:helix-turn-helix domain-containing protein [Pseudomonas kuykendallii]|uniref:Cytoskeleton protein RodZ n=1 Tax=Pseudomonas kuykendallii TaxID=1007099 RepID=A0A1H2XKZ4_9PSED|nr:RodZ family helix-turn-helix domain-containing protein [Pseudomonas kuykendallii]MCQ4272666.1 helix-turn-helix domain-containing protein [Pseudomonas kuykendallii]SDW93561.1 cytoskeleton protein RodZ [Pseudomonas kuykendallii]